MDVKTLAGACPPRYDKKRSRVHEKRPRSRTKNATFIVGRGPVPRHRPHEKKRLFRSVGPRRTS